MSYKALLNEARPPSRYGPATSKLEIFADSLCESHFPQEKAASPPKAHTKIGMTYISTNESLPGQKLQISIGQSIFSSDGQV